MTPEAQNKAISDATGLCPKCDYGNDLNAMHAAEKIMVGPGGFIDPSNFYRRYILMLHEVVEQRDYGFSATASQRREAFVKTLGKWIE